MFDRDFDGFMSDLGRIIQKYETAKAMGDFIYLEVSEYEELFDHYFSTGDFEQAISLIQSGCKAHPYAGSLSLKHAEVLLELGQLEQAEEWLDVAESLQPNDLQIVLNRADLLAMRDKHQQAIDLVNDHLRIASEEEAIELYIELADIYEDVEHYVEVIEALEALLKLHPKHVDALNRLWFAVELTGMYAKSIEIHQGLLDKDPYHEAAWFNIAQAHIGMENLKEAISALEFVLAINEGHDAASILCADLYVELQDYEKALALYHSVLELNLPNRDVFLRLANCYAMVNDVDEAKVYYRRCISLDPRNDEAFYGLGCCLLAEEKYEDCLSPLEKAVRLNRSNLDYSITLMEAYKELSDWELAISLLKDIVKDNPDNQRLMMELAMLYVEAGEVQDAIDWLEDCIELFPHEADFHFAHAVYCYTLGRRNQAIISAEQGMVCDEQRASHWILSEPHMADDPLFANLLRT